MKHKLNRDFMGNKTQKISSQIGPYSAGGCFIATAVYGSSNYHKLDVFREFRDVILLKNRIGKTFVWLYYRTSPKMAKSIKKRWLLKHIVLYSLIEPIYRLLKSILKR